MKTAEKSQWKSWIRRMLLCAIGASVLAGCGSSGGGGDDANRAPVASLSASVVDGMAPLEVTFDGSASSDPDGEALAFQWDFGDGTPAAVGAAPAPHSYTTPGQYTAVLTVADLEGETATASAVITVRAAVDVPDVTGLTQTAAEAALVAAGLTVGDVTTQNSDAVPAGAVISQDPAAAVSVAEGSPVDLVVSLGPVLSTAPDLAGLTQTAAEAAIVAAGLTVGTVTTENSDVVPADSVIGQVPAANASVLPGSSVDLVVSLGPVLVSVPAVAGLTQSAAEAALVAAGLAVGTVTTECSTVVPADSVISQDPAAGVSVAEGSTVNLVVSLDESGDLPPDPATVRPELDLTVATTMATATSFLYTGSNPIQTGMAADTIDARRAAVIRGRVLDRSNDPLSGVAITILGHPEFGTTLSRTDGMFDMAINGGGYLTVNYQKSDYLPVQRQIDVPWQDYAHTPDIVMIGLDSEVTNIDLAAPEIQVARGSEVTDNDGTRRATMLFTPGTTAELVLPDGSTQPLSVLNIRATEYTVGDNGPEAMPAELPPSTAYTYAVELSAEEALSAGATSVRFNQPVYTYVENFIGAPVGTAVPTGYYDRAKGQWIASQNGRVISVLDVPGGIAALDTDGDGAEDDATVLAVLNITDAEREQIGSLYGTGQTLWRVPMTHLTPWDCNWPYVPPPDAIGPNGGDPKRTGGDPEDDPCEGSGSIIECQNQTLGERIGLVGTPYSLNYRSDRVTGRKLAYSVDIPVSGETIPESLVAIGLEIRVAGRMFVETLPAAPNQSYVFIWDGLDVYGRQLQGEQPITVYITFKYPAIYYAISSEFENAFNSVQGSSGSGDNTASFSFTARPNVMQVDSGRTWQGRVGSQRNTSADLGSWSLGMHHSYSPPSHALYFGNGQRRSSTKNISRIIDTVAGGGGASGYLYEDGMLATETYLPSLGGVACHPNGSFYFTNGHGVLKVNQDGIITTVAGNQNVQGFSGDGGLATAALLNNPVDVAIDGDGNIYIADYWNYRVRKVDTDGFITTVAGNGNYVYNGDGINALDAQFYPSVVATGIDGSVYIADSTNDRVRRVSSDGIISTVAGYGYGNGYTDGSLAIDVALTDLRDIDIAYDGSLYISNGGYRVYKVDIDGIINTVAGNDTTVFSGDGGFAIDASIYGAQGIAAGPDGSIYIADVGHRRIRKVDATGIIRTIAGNGTYGLSSDGELATDSRLSAMSSIDISEDGDLHYADRANNRIRKVIGTLPSFSLGDIAITATDGHELYHFDSYGRHLGTFDTLSGNVIYDFQYDSSGFLIEIEDRDGQITTIERDASGVATAIVAPLGERTALQMEANGYLSSIINPAGERTELTYTDDGLLTAMEYPGGSTSLFTYDEWGLLVRDEDPSGGYQTFARSDDDTGYTVTRTTAMGRVTTFRMEDLPTGERFSLKQYPDGTWNKAEFGLQGDQTTTYCDGTIITMKHGPDPRFGMQAPVLEMLEITSPAGLTNRIDQRRTVLLDDPANLLSLQTLEDTLTVNDRTFQYQYDAATRVLATTTPEGRLSQNTLDEQGRVIRIDIAEGIDPVTILYDSYGSVSRAAQGEQSWDYTYDSGRIVSRTDAAGVQMFFAYDAADRMTQMQLPEGETIGYAYDQNGNQTQVVMPSSAVHTLGYTPRNFLASYAPPDNVALTHAYDFDKARTSTTLASGKIVTNTFDEQGRWTAITYPLAEVTFSYAEGCNRLETMGHTPAGGGTAQNIAYTYDGRLLTGISYSGVVVGAYTYSYDNNFFLTQTNLSSGSDTVQIDISHDGDGLVTGYGPFSLTRNGPGGTISEISDGVLVSAATYDTLGRVASITYTVNETLVYGYALTRDDVGNMRQKIETTSGGSLASLYAYDDNIQLITITQGGIQVENYTYDHNGNRLTTLAAAASYDAQDRIISIGDTDYLFDVDGYLTSRGDDNFAYSVRGELMEISMGDGKNITYAYDGHRRRVGRTDSSGTYQYFYGNPYNPLQITSIRDPNGTLSTLYYDPNGLLFAMDRGASRYYVAADQLGTPRVVADASGAVVKVMEYDGFGQVTSDTNPSFDLPMGFAGGLVDPVSGLVRFGFRDYDPQAGRWTARDPILFDGGQANLYVYVANNPIGLRDPSGLWCIGASGYAGVGGGVELCCSNGKCSLCGEIGLGLGVGGGVGSGDAKSTGSKVVSEAGASCGPIGAGVKCEYGYKCGAKCSGQANVGPASIDTSGDVKVGGSGGAEKALNARCSAQAKLVGEYCGQF